MSTPLLEARGICKRYGQVEALRGADFSAYAGEVVALIGDNGAGKSTLVKALSGTIPPDAGEVVFDGTPVTFHSPIDARALGIETVYQDLAIAAELGAAENIFMGREVLKPGWRGRLGILDKKSMHAQTQDLFTQFKVTVPDLREPVVSYSGGQRQSVAICRSVKWAQRMVFMDEPTAALGVVQTERVLDLIRRARDSGVAVVLISHNMTDVLSVADRIEVLRLGQRVASLRGAQTNLQELVEQMTGGTATAASSG